jgi:hypothetical protein
MDFIPFQSFDNYIEAHILMGRMQDEGIDCWLKDENTVTIDPILSNAIGGIKLMIPNTQLEQATELWKQYQEEKRQYYRCPSCNSNNIELINTPRKAINWITAITTWVLGNYAMAGEQVWHCFDCEAEFKTPVEIKPDDFVIEE